MEKLSCVRQSAQELKSKMIMQGDDAIYITDEKTEIRKLVIQGHKLHSDWARTQMQGH